MVVGYAKPTIDRLSVFSEFISQNLIWVAAFVVVANLWVWSFVQGKVKGVSTVSPLSLPALQRGGKSVIMDVSPQENFAKAHIPDAINFPVNEINADNSALMKHKSKTVIIVCQSGTQSSKAARSLVALGFEDLHILNGGLMSWSKENLPLESANQS